MPTTRRLGAVSLVAMLSALTACSTAPTIPAASQVDIPRFMGDWYVIANIPTRFERDAYNAVESYRLDDDGSIATTFTFREGGFDGPEKVMRPRGFVRDDGSNAIWGMQFVWPIKAEYVIAHVDTAYTETIIARRARTPTIPEQDFQRLVGKVAALGYDTSKLQKVPQRWNQR